MLIGQKAELFWDGHRRASGTLVQIQQENERSNGLGFYTEDMGLLFYPYIDVVFLLRRLESITEEETKEAFFAFCGQNYDDVYTDNDAKCSWWMEHEEWHSELRKLAIGEPNVWFYLLSKGFDLFGLIDAGLAKEIQLQNT